MPRPRPTASAVRRLSLEITATWRPSSLSDAIAVRALGRIWSAAATKPAASPSTATYMAVFPSSASRSARSVSPFGRMPSRCSRRAFPTASRRPSTVAFKPCPATASKSSVSASSRPRSRAARMMAAASGCSDPCSALATSRSSSSFERPSEAIRSVRAGSPTVSVPVLSSAIASSAPTPSSVAASSIRMLCRAPIPVPTATAVGVARPSASGQAITTCSRSPPSTRAASKPAPQSTVSATPSTTCGARIWAKDQNRHPGLARHPRVP